jgi:hypothetical protein
MQVHSPTQRLAERECDSTTSQNKSKLQTKQPPESMAEALYPTKSMVSNVHDLSRYRDL